MINILPEGMFFTLWSCVGNMLKPALHWAWVLIYTGVLFHSSCIRVLSSIISCICHEVTFHVRQEEAHTALHFRDNIYVIVTKSKLLILQKCSVGVQVTDNASTSTKSVISVLIVQITQMRLTVQQHVTLKKGTVNGQMPRLETTTTGFVTRAKPLQDLLGLLLTIHSTHQQVCVISHVSLCIINRGFINRFSDNHGLNFRGFSCI